MGNSGSGRKAAWAIHMAELIEWKGKLSPPCKHRNSKKATDKILEMDSANTVEGTEIRVSAIPPKQRNLELIRFWILFKGHPVLVRLMLRLVWRDYRATKTRAVMLRISAKVVVKSNLNLAGHAYSKLLRHNCCNSSEPPLPEIAEITEPLPKIWCSGAVDKELTVNWSYNRSDTAKHTESSRIINQDGKPFRKRD